MGISWGVCRYFLQLQLLWGQKVGALLKGIFDLRNINDKMCNLLLLFSCQVMSSSLQPHVLLHTRLPWVFSQSPRVCSNSCHWIGDAIQPSYPLSPTFPPAFILSQQQDLFQWVSSSHQLKPNRRGCCENLMSWCLWSCVINFQVQCCCYCCC